MWDLATLRCINRHEDQDVSRASPESDSKPRIDALIERIRQMTIQGELDIENLARLVDGT